MSNLSVKPITFSSDIADYVIQNGFVQQDCSILPGALVFLKDGKALVFDADVIAYKEPIHDEPVNVLRILFNWEPVKFFKGFDGHNTFQLMMLLDFMDAIKVKDVATELRAKMIGKELLSHLPKLDEHEKAIA